MTTEKERLIAEFELEREVLALAHNLLDGATVTIATIPIYAPPAGYKLLDEPDDSGKH